MEAENNELEGESILHVQPHVSPRETYDVIDAAHEQDRIRLDDEGN